MVDRLAAEFTARIQREAKAIKEKEEQTNRALQEKEERVNRAIKEQEMQINRERKLLEEEKAKMGTVEKDEVIEVNVGGEVFAAKRRTFLQAEGTILEAIFSGRWEGSLDRDAQQRVFLDFSPALFRALLSYLRARRDAKPGQTVHPPMVPSDLKCEFESMVGYLDLSKYMNFNYPPAPDALICRQVGAPDTTMTISGHVITRTNASSSHLAVLGQRPLLGDGADRAMWRVTLKKLGNTVFSAGIIENMYPSGNAYSDPTCYSWSWGKQVYVAGANRNADSGWDTWQAGDVGIFQLDAALGQLKMYHKRTARMYIIYLNASHALRRMHLLLHFYDGTTVVELGPAAQEDLVKAGFV